MPDTVMPVEIRLLQKQKQLIVQFENGEKFEWTCEFLRVHSPSAEVRGHGSQPAKLVVGKEQVSIIAVEPIGQYAVKLVFDDGHDTGLYTWSYLYELGKNKNELWKEYLKRVAAANV